jgi:hypothetical protein
MSPAPFVTSSGKTITEAKLWIFVWEMLDLNLGRKPRFLVPPHPISWIAHGAFLANHFQALIKRTFLLFAGFEFLTAVVVKGTFHFA